MGRVRGYRGPARLAGLLLAGAVALVGVPAVLVDAGPAPPTPVDRNDDGWTNRSPSTSADQRTKVEDDFKPRAEPAAVDGGWNSRAPTTVVPAGGQSPPRPDRLPDTLVPVRQPKDDPTPKPKTEGPVLPAPKKADEPTHADPSPAKGDGRLSWALGVLPPGTEQVVKVRLKAAATADPKFLHTIEVAYQGRGQNAREGTIRQAALELSVAPPDAVPVGTPAPIRITITNPGNAPARDVVLQSSLPDGLAHRAGQDLENNLGVIEAGQSRTLNLTVTPKQVGDFAAQLKLHAKAAKSVEATARVKATPALLSLAVTAPPAVEANKPALFELVIGNDAGDPKKGAELVVKLPKEVIFVRATDRGVYDPIARTVKWDLGSVAAGERRAVVWNGIIKEPGKLSFAASLKAAGKDQKEVECPVHAVPADLPPLPPKGDK